MGTSSSGEVPIPILARRHRGRGERVHRVQSVVVAASLEIPRHAALDPLDHARQQALNGDAKGVDAKEREQVEQFRKSLAVLGYNDTSARSAIWFLVKRR